MNIAPDHITHLAPNQVFVFGSNFAGRHGKGAAKQALRWGARRGQGTGLMGQTYGLATKDADLRVLRLDQIAVQVARFYRVAAQRPDLTFLVTQVGCGLAGYQPREIAPMFHAPPPNVYLPLAFWKILTNVTLS